MHQIDVSWLLVMGAFIPAEIQALLEDFTKARLKLGRSPKITFAELVAEVIREDMNSDDQDDFIKRHGYKPLDYHE